MSRKRTTRMYGFSGLNENGEWLLELRVEKALVDENAWLKKRCHKHTWKRGEQKSVLNC